jgi:hypothetical protein
MCSVGHVAVGALVGGVVGDRLYAFLVGVASHIPLDAMPHIDFEDFRVDAAMSVALLAGIFAFSGFSPMFVGALGAVAPDFENLLWKLGIIQEEKKVFPTHSGLIKHGRAKAGSGPATEVLMSAFSVAVVVLAIMIGGEH